MQDFGNENVLKYPATVFAETIILKVKQLRDYVPKKRKRTNTDLTGKYIEELVRGFIHDWIGHKELLTGTFYFQKFIDSKLKPPQIDGIVYDPLKGPVTIREGNFVIVHPAFCVGIIEIKMTCNIKNLEKRLQSHSNKYLCHLGKPHVMGVVIADKDPEKNSLHDYNNFYLCPIFILFKEKEDGEYEPYVPAIEAMIKAIYHNFRITTPSYF